MDLLKPRSLGPRASFVLVFAAVLACRSHPEALARPAAPLGERIQALSTAGTHAYATASAATPPGAVVPGQELAIYAGGLKNGWQDWGWAHRSLPAGQPAHLNMTKYAGWILGSHTLAGNFTQLRFDVQAPANFGSFLEVRLGMDGAPDDAFARIPVDTQAKANDQGFVHVQIPVAMLNPQAIDFDRIIFRARTNVGSQDVLVNNVALLAGFPADKPQPTAKAALPLRPVKLRINCRAATHPISEGIYGIAFSPRKVGKDKAPFALNASVRRWGGNPASRYNWKLGNAWNTASDWFFKNVNYTNKDDYSWRDFLAENEANNMRAAITLPTIGWVAKDTTSYAFSEAELGKQKYAQEDAGNGVSATGQKLRCKSPTTTSLAASPAYVAEWVKALEAYQADGHAGSIAQYILDNEPALWNSTHRDIHPDALTYDELLERTVAYGEAVRAAAPKAQIAGPAEWGWPAYFFSAKDQEMGFSVKPDRRAHGDVPLLEWYLRNLRKRAEKTGTHVLDTVDLHFYPQISGVYGHGEQTTAQGAARRLRATRSLWDPSYKDESWIADTIQLLPRLKNLIAANYPGRKISIGEYNFGGEQHISGALALAESLGRFAQHDVHSAYLWTYPPEHSPASQAFLSFRNYDGEGGHFLDNYVATQMTQEVSLFASSDSKNAKLVAIALNLQADADADADIELVGCGEFKKVRRYGLSEADTTLAAQANVGELGAQSGRLHTKLPGYSISVFELSR